MTKETVTATEYLLMYTRHGRTLPVSCAWIAAVRSSRKGHLPDTGPRSKSESTPTVCKACSSVTTSGTDPFKYTVQTAAQHPMSCRNQVRRWRHRWGLCQLVLCTGRRSSFEADRCKSFAGSLLQHTELAFHTSKNMHLAGELVDHQSAGESWRGKPEHRRRFEEMMT